jgi:hypothetical protein
MLTKDRGHLWVLALAALGCGEVPGNGAAQDEDVVQVSSALAANAISAYSTSGIGNSFIKSSHIPGGSFEQKHVPKHIGAVAVGNSNVGFSNGPDDEGGCPAAAWSNVMDRQCLGNVGSFAGGIAIAANASYVFVGQQVNGQHGVSRRKYYDVGVNQWGTIGAPFSGPGVITFGSPTQYFMPISPTTYVAGLALEPTPSPPTGPSRLFLTAGAELRVYDVRASTVSLICTLTTTGGTFGGVAAGTTKLWAIHRPTSGDPVVRRYALPAPPSAACPATTHEAAITVPGAAGLGIDNQGRLMVADGKLNQITLYNSSGTFVGSIGPASGAYGAPAGQVTPQRLVSPLAVAGYVNGDILVGSTLAGGDLRKLSATGQPVQPMRKSSFFADVPVVDPSVTDGTSFIGHDVRFSFDYSKPIGQEGTYVGVSVNPLTRPDDPRRRSDLIRSTLAAKAVQLLPGIPGVSGRKLVAITNTTMTALGIFRADTQPGAEGLIASAFFAPFDHTDHNNFPGKPAIGRWMWRDGGSGNGNMEAGEYPAAEQSAAPDGMVTGWDLDHRGNVWQAVNDATGGIRRFRLKSFDPVPTYSYVAPWAKLWAPPTIATGVAFTSVKRVKYVAPDSLYVLGNTNANPYPAVNPGVAQLAGTELVRYDGWCGTSGEVTCEGNRTSAKGRIILPNNDTDGWTIAFDVAGDRIFVALFPKSTDHVLVYNTKGGFIGRLTPDATKVGVAGWIDMAAGIHAFKRGSEYVVTVEEVWSSKALVYRGTMACTRTGGAILSDPSGQFLGACCVVNGVDGVYRRHSTLPQTDVCQTN